MSLTTLFEKIAGKQRQREKAKYADYRDLVARIGRGKEPDPDTVDRVLAEAGKTLRNLQEDIELLMCRKHFRERYDRLPALAEERREIEQQIAVAAGVLETAEKQYEQATAPLYARLATIKREVSDGQDAERSLVQTCVDEDLLAELAAVTETLREANTRRFELEKETRQLREWAESDRDEVKHASFASRIEQLHDRADDRDARAEHMDAELADLRKRIADLERREKSIRERMLEP